MIVPLDWDDPGSDRIEVAFEHRVQLRWALLDTDPTITGSVDGVEFTATVPAF